MIIGTTSQLMTILIVTAIGIGIAIILLVIKRDRYKILFGGVMALMAGVWISYRIYRYIEINGLSGGVFGLVFLGLFAFSAAIGLFMNMKDSV